MESLVNIFCVGCEGRCFLVPKRRVAAANVRKNPRRRTKPRAPSSRELDRGEPHLDGNAEPEFFALRDEHAFTVILKPPPAYIDKEPGRRIDQADAAAEDDAGRRSENDVETVGSREVDVAERGKAADFDGLLRPRSRPRLGLRKRIAGTRPREQAGNGKDECEWSQHRWPFLSGQAEAAKRRARVDQTVAVRIVRSRRPLVSGELLHRR